MLFLSFCPGDEGDGPKILAIHQTFKNVEKYYRLIKIIPLLCTSDNGEIAAVVEENWRDKEHSAHKRIFSQDRRPAKVVRENPRLMVNCAGAGERLMHDLRRRDIPVEGFFIHASGSWSRETVGKALGDNYRVNVADLISTAAAVYARNRLDLAHCMAPVDDLSAEIDRLKAARVRGVAGSDSADGITPTDLLLGLSIPVWFRENIRYHRPYRA